MTWSRRGVAQCWCPRWRTLSLVLVCVFLSSSVAAQEFPEVAPGQAVTVHLSVPAGGLPPSALHVTPAQGVTVDGAVDALLTSGEIPIVVTVPRTARPGLFSAATVSFSYPDGRRLTTHCYLWVRPVGSTADPLPLPMAAMSPVPALPSPNRQPTPADAALIAASDTDNPQIAQSPPNTLVGVMYVGASELGTRGRSEADLGMGVDVKGRVNGSTHVNALYIHGWNPGLSPVFRYGMHRWRGHLRVKAPQFSFDAGEIRTETPLAGIKAPADGVLFQKTRGPLIGSVAAARPKYFAGGWGGHLLQGNIGYAFRNGAIGLFASELARPAASSRVAPLPAPEEDSELVIEDLQQVGALLSRENRVRAGGIESRFRFGSHHIVARGGWLDLLSPTNDRVTGPAATGSYSFMTPRASFYSQFRRMPGALPGISLSGDLVTAGGKVKLRPSLALVGRTYWTESSLLGRNSQTRGTGAAGGLEYSKDLTRFQLQANYRESKFLSTAITRSMTAGLRLPMGTVAGLDGALELGEVEDGRRRRRIVSFRGAVYAEGESGSLMLSGTYRDYGVSNPRLSLDVSGSMTLRHAIVEGGAGISRAGIFGDLAHAWTTVEFPLPAGLTLMLGADYDRWSFEDSPYLVFLVDTEDETPPWHFTVNVRRRVSIPLPFLK